jgi:hypothetical protein
LLLFSFSNLSLAFSVLRGCALGFAMSFGAAFAFAGCFFFFLRGFSSSSWLWQPEFELDEFEESLE